MNFKAIILVGLIAILISAIYIRTSVGKENEVTPEEVKKMIDEKKDIFILDVRTPGEYKFSHIEGAVLINVNDVLNHLSEIPKDKDVIVLCAVGGRSSVATNRLLNSGYDRVFNMVGGMKAWEAKGYPVVKQYDSEK